MQERVFAWVGTYERHLSALAMFGGFVLDTLLFERVDLPRTQFLFLSYTVACALAISALHYLESRTGEGRPRLWIRPFLPIITQFALGGFLSGVLVVYGRSAAVGVSWPFLLLIALMFLGNEVLRKYHDRLIFTNTLFFFSFYSFAIFTLPVYTKSLGVGTFLLSSGLAIGFFILFTRWLRFIGKERFLADVRHIRASGLVVLGVMHLFYFTNVVPPLPLSLQSGGIYHFVSRVGNDYVAQTEDQPLRVLFGSTPTLHVVPGEALYAYSAVFAPIRLNTTIRHRWQHYNEETRAWETASVISFPILGGRDQGYRAYSLKTNPRSGAWRVVVETGEGKVVGSVHAMVVATSSPPRYISRTLE